MLVKCSKCGKRIDFVCALDDLGVVGCDRTMGRDLEKNGWCR